MRKILAMLLIVGSFFITNVSQAAQLFMIHSPSCGYCLLFLNEVYPFYDESTQSEILPLKIFNVRDPNIREWIQREIEKETMKPTLYTPTFIIWDNDREIGRITGYAGTDWFYEQLDIIIEKYNLDKGE